MGGVIAATEPGGTVVTFPLTPDLSGADGPLQPPWFTPRCLPALQLVSHSLQAPSTTQAQSGLLLPSGDFDLSFNVAYAAADGHPDDGGVAFRAAACFEDDEHYLLTGNPADGSHGTELDVVTGRGSTFTRIVLGTNSSLTEGSSHTWRLVVSGGYVYAYLDGAPFLSSAIDLLAGQRAMWFSIHKPGTAITAITIAAAAADNTSDSFDRANSSTSLGSPDVGAAWSVLTSGATFGITSDKAYLSSTTSQASAASDSGTATGSIAADITTSAVRTDAGLVINASDDNNYILAVLAWGSTQNAIRLYKRDGGTFTQLGSDYVTPMAASTTYRFSVIRTSATVKVYLGNTLAQSYTLTSAEQAKYNANTKHGIRVNYFASGPTADDGGTRFDNYVVRA